jgi:hypothetical protein
MEGPLDETILAVTNALLKHRGVRLGEIEAREGETYYQHLQQIRTFARRVGRMAATDDEAVDAAMEDVLHGFKARIGLLDFSTTARELLAKFVGKGWGRGLTISGRFYVEIRSRVSHWNKCARPQSTPRPSPGGPKEGVFLFGGEFPASSCGLNRNPGVVRGRPMSQSPQWSALDLCIRGCDLTLLVALGFKRPVIARILGLQPTTLDNRLRHCEDVIRPLRPSIKDGRPPSIIVLTT